MVSSFACAGLLITSFVVGGACQSIWFAHPYSRRFSMPIDCGGSFRGRRIFGDNKTVRGFLVIVPATALAMTLFGFLAAQFGLGVWSLSPIGFLLLGTASAFGLMLGELPNSFLKRQLDVEPGQPPKHRVGRVVSTIADRLDSVIGALVGAAFIVDMTWATIAWCFVLGPPIHGLFSRLLFVLGVKKRPG
jgi:hypothetical protein